jgi:hypothetical protein
MARNQGTFNFSANLEVLKQGPLDARLTVESQSELTGLPFSYKGMIVAVTDDSTPANNGVYVLDDADGTVLGNWTQLGTSSGSVTYDSEFPTTQEVPNTVGGIESGTTVASLEGQTFSQLFDALLFPAIEPTTTDPSINLTDDIANLVEIGSSVNITFTTTANQGTVNNSWDGTTEIYAGAVTAASYTDPSSTSNTLTVGPGDTDVADFSESGYSVTEGNHEWELSVTFATGTDYDDSNGNTIVGSAYPGGTLTKTTSFEGVYPIFLGNSSGTEDKRTLVSHSANNIECEQLYDETSSLRHRIAIPDDMIDSQTVSFQQFNTLNSQWETLNNEFTSSSVTRTVQGNTVNYTLYTKSSPIGGSAEYRIVFN